MTKEQKKSETVKPIPLHLPVEIIPGFTAKPSTIFTAEGFINLAPKGKKK